MFDINKIQYNGYRMSMNFFRRFDALSINNMYVDDIKKYERAMEIEETLFSLKFDASQE